jgi:hypothetical protein
MKEVANRGGLLCLIISGDLIEGNLQFCSPLLAILFLEFPFAMLESDEFLFGRLQKAFAWRYRQLSVSRHHAPTIASNMSTQVPEPAEGSVP